MGVPNGRRRAIFGRIESEPTLQPGAAGWKGLSRFATLSFGMFTVGMFGEIVGSLDIRNASPETRS